MAAWPLLAALAGRIKRRPFRARFLFFFFSSPSKCTGFTRISEDSSEIAFLLVENYIPDRSQSASAGWGIFGNPQSFLGLEIFFIFSSSFNAYGSLSRGRGEEGNRGRMHGLVTGFGNANVLLLEFREDLDGPCLDTTCVDSAGSVWGS